MGTYNNTSRLKSLQNENEPIMLSSRKDSEEMSPKAKVSYDETKFQVEFDVKDYKPEELSIKTEGTTLVVLAKHEEKSGDSSYVTKQFEQRFTLPSGVKSDAISSSLSRDGKPRMGLNLITQIPYNHLRQMKKGCHILR